MVRTVDLDDIITFDGSQTTIRREFKGKGASKFGVLGRSLGQPEAERCYALLSREGAPSEAIPISRRAYDELLGLGVMVA